jgi:hypothetical protein
MNNRAEYMPGYAGGAEVRQDGEKWTLILVGELRHAPIVTAGPAGRPTFFGSIAP